MSLINEMLRDLESRKATNNTPPPLQKTFNVKQSTGAKIPRLLLALITIPIIGASVGLYQYRHQLIKSTEVIVADTRGLEKPVTVNEVLNTALPIKEPLITKSVDIEPISVVQTTAPLPLAPSKQLEEQVVALNPAPKVLASPVKKAVVIPKSLPIQHASPKQQADLWVRHVEKNVDDGSAVIKLEQALQLDPGHLKARLLLAKLLYDQGQVNRLAEFLDQCLLLFPDNLQFINTRTQLFLQQKDPNAAFKVLQGIDTNNSADETYLSLLAATYQQLQFFTNAVKVYQRLVDINSGKAEYWLGLALAYEQLGNLALAREAYQQALTKNNLSESLQTYIKQRLIDLG